MFNLFRKKVRQLTPIQQAQHICDAANAVMPDLPRGVSFWMDWSQRPPRLILQERMPGRQIFPAD